MRLYDLLFFFELFIFYTSKVWLYFHFILWNSTSTTFIHKVWSHYHFLVGLSLGLHESGLKLFKLNTNLIQNKIHFLWSNIIPTIWQALGQSWGCPYWWRKLIFKWGLRHLNLFTRFVIFETLLSNL